MNKDNKNTELENTDKKLHISDVSDSSLIKYRGKVYKILKTYAPWRIGTKYYSLEDIETGEKFYDIPSCDCLHMDYH